jgi:hypothetical protein
MRQCQAKLPYIYGKIYKNTLGFRRSSTGSGNRRRENQGVQENKKSNKETYPEVFEFTLKIKQFGP